MLLFLGIFLIFLGQVGFGYRYKYAGCILWNQLFSLLDILSLLILPVLNFIKIRFSGALIRDGFSGTVGKQCFKCGSEMDQGDERFARLKAKLPGLEQPLVKRIFNVESGLNGFFFIEAPICARCTSLIASKLKDLIKFYSILAVVFPIGILFYYLPFQIIWNGFNPAYCQYYLVDTPTAIFLLFAFITIGLHTFAIARYYALYRFLK